MKNFNVKAIALSVSLAFSVGAIAQTMSKNDYKVSRDRISAEYKSAKAACGSMSGNRKDISVQEAKGKEMIVKTELEAQYKPTAKSHYKANVAKAEAVYGVAKERCDDLAGNAKDVCVKEAKAALVTAKADAKLRMESWNANAKVNEKTADARSNANVELAEAREQAAEDKSDAHYKVAKEKCDVLAGSTKDRCVDEAKARFGK